MTRLFTFGLAWDGEVCEELDVQASSSQEARRLALILAEADYRPGWELVSLEPGGSGGLFQVL